MCAASSPPPPQMTSRQLLTESRKCEKRQKEEEGKVLAAMKKGQTEVARIHAANAIREKNQSINFLRLSSRIDAVSARVETAIRMNTVRVLCAGIAAAARDVSAPARSSRQPPPCS